MQFLIYFSMDGNGGTGNDSIGYDSRDNSAAANRPQLVVTYQ